ncbi:MAG: hypothetical protein HY553_22260, partial [Elusimicrobia bacterium]|nr:hypothetical protein [Elusimicrobiota bacterium]
ACEGALEAIRSDIQHIYRMDVGCAQLEAAAKLLPVVDISPALGTWSYGGEADIREELWRRWQIRFSTAVMPMGLVERDAPEGGGWLIVFGLELPRRAWALLALTQHEGRIPRAGPAAVLAEGALYDWLGFYRRDPEGGVSKDGRWIKLEAGGAWSPQRPPPLGETRACVPCRGWLCPPDPIACFSDFNLNGQEETVLIDDCQPHACGVRLLEPDAKGQVAMLFNEPGVYGQWTRRAEGWILVSDVYCPWGEFCGEGDDSLGNPNCERPSVYRVRKDGRLKADPELRDEYYPIQNKKAPLNCSIDSDLGVIVYTKEGRFVRYLAQ